MTKVLITGAICLFSSVLIACASSPGGDQNTSKFDVDDDGFLTPEEYSASKLSKVLSFEELDVDADGLLSAAELGFSVREGRPARGKQEQGGEGRRGGHGGKSRT